MDKIKAIIISICLFSCNHKKEVRVYPALHVDTTNWVYDSTTKVLNVYSTTVKDTWMSQNIDSVKSCDIIPCERMKIIKVGHSYTATYQMGDELWFKSSYIDFQPDGSGVQYFPDSCKLKESLRGFIKLQMVKYISNKMAQPQ